jgi:hypothetical protein
MSYAMDERQATRKNGKYSKMNKCEICQKSVGASYFSADDCDETGKGLVLCKTCCKAYNLGKRSY